MGKRYTGGFKKYENKNFDKNGRKIELNGKKKMRGKTLQAVKF